MGIAKGRVFKLVLSWKRYIMDTRFKQWCIGHDLKERDEMGYERWRLGQLRVGARFALRQKRTIGYYRVDQYFRLPLAPPSQAVTAVGDRFSRGRNLAIFNHSKGDRVTVPGQVCSALLNLASMARNLVPLYRPVGPAAPAFANVARLAPVVKLALGTRISGHSADFALLWREYSATLDFPHTHLVEISSPAESGLARMPPSVATELFFFARERGHLSA